MLVIPLLTACLGASRGEKTQVPTAADSAQASGSETREQSDGSSRVKKKRSTAAAKDGIQRQKQYIQNYDYCRTTRCRSIGCLHRSLH